MSYYTYSETMEYLYRNAFDQDNEGMSWEEYVDYYETMGREEDKIVAEYHRDLLPHDIL